jgi:hypothetical protein
LVLLCPLYNAVPLTARCGLLLVRLDADRDDSILHLAVCNLLVGVCDELPPLGGDAQFSKSGYAILTSTDCSSSSTEEQLLQDYLTFSKVIVIGMTHYASLGNLYIFSASEGRWSLPRKLILDDTAKGKIRGPLRSPDAVVCGGMLHWVLGNRRSKLHMLDVDTETCGASRKEIFAPANGLGFDEPQLRATADGRLSLIFLRRPDLTLHIYMRQEDSGESEDDADAGWIYSGIVKLKPPQYIERRETLKMYLGMLGEKGGTILLSDTQHVYTVDLETGAMDEVADCFGSQHPIRPNIMLLEMDWRAFFAYRLGS